MKRTIKKEERKKSMKEFSLLLSRSFQVFFLLSLFSFLLFVGCPSDDTCSHDFKYKTTIAATCIAEGAEIETCTKC